MKWLELVCACRHYLLEGEGPCREFDNVTDTCMHTVTYTHTGDEAACAGKQSFTHTRTHTRAHTHKHTHTHTQGHTHKDTHAYTHTHTEAQGGLHIVEQSLWNAIPSYLRRMSSALKKHTGRDLPLSATPFRFGSWMGGDRDGNPNVTAQVRASVYCNVVRTKFWSKPPFHCPALN